MNTLAALVLFFAGWLLLFILGLGLFGLVWWRRLAGKMALLLDGLRFIEPTQSLDSVNLPPAE